MNIYENNKALNTLDKLLLHINIKSLDVPSVKEEIKSLNLFSTLLYMHLNGADLDYITIKKIYNTIAKNNQNKYKEFKPFFLKFFDYFKKEKNLWSNAGNFFCNSCLNSQKKLQEIKYRGV